MGSDLQQTYSPSTVDTLLSTTTSYWLKNEAEDNIFNLTPFLKKMYAKAVKVDGGASIVVPLMYETNSASTWYDGYDIINTMPQSGLTASSALWKNLATTVSINGAEERRNSGNNAKVNLLNAKIKQAELSLKKEMTDAIFATSNATNKVESFGNIFSTTTSLQGISGTTYSWWQANVNASVGSFATNGLTQMRTYWTAVSKVTPETAPDMIVTTDTVFNAYEGSLTPQTRYTPQDKIGNASFSGLMFKTAEVIYDAACPSGTICSLPIISSLCLTAMRI
jgi:hypothetical protein